jgi:hypothetical protein
MVFISPSKANSGMVPPLDHSCFFPNTFQFIIHQLFYHRRYSLDTESAVKQTTEAAQILHSVNEWIIFVCMAINWETQV